MIVNSTDLKNNLGKYLRLSAREEIIITTSGRKVAKLTAYEDNGDAAHDNISVTERAQTYEVTPRKASYEEYVELSENSDQRFEYIDGEIYLLASPNTSHQIVLGELYVVFYNWFHGTSSQPMLAPFDITLKRNAENINVVQPDLMVICDLEANLNERDYYMGVPALVVEIISESTRNKDFIKKLDLYMSTGVGEYWIVNPLNREVSVYRFEENNIVQNATFKKDETAVSYYFGGLEVSLGKVFV
jgi:prevent-host-death family protein